MRLGCIAVAALLWAAPAAAKPKLPPCPPKADQLFLSPMGEPFRAGKDAAYPLTTWFAGGDSDYDGRLTRAEFVADADRFFTTLDRNKDGEIVPDEMSLYERTVAPEIRLYARRDPGASAKRREDGSGQLPGAGRWAFLNIPQPVAAADADFNRGVTREEFRAAAAERFRRLDKMRAGALDLGSLPTTPAQAAATACIAAPPAKPRR